MKLSRYHVVLFSTCICLFVSHSHSQAATITESQFVNLVAAIESSGESIDRFNSDLELQSALENMDEVAALVQRHVWLEQLSKKKRVSDFQHRWVNQQLDSKLTLEIINSDHADRTMLGFNIGFDAAKVVTIQAINRQADLAANQWQSGEFKWREWLVKDKVKIQGLIRWLGSLPDSNRQVVAQHFVAQALTIPNQNNQVLLALVHFEPSEVLLSHFLAQTPDEFSFLLLQQLPQLVDEELAVNTLITAMKQPQLISQTILLLSSHYASHIKAQKQIMRSLNDPDQQWLAMMSLSKIKDSYFKQKLLAHFREKNTRFSKIALAQFDAETEL